MLKKKLDPTPTSLFTWIPFSSLLPSLLASLLLMTNPSPVPPLVAFLKLSYLLNDLNSLF
jgi:hypothetical protein